MQRKFRITGFARFFLVMIIVAPLAYIAASYYNGEDGIANIKRLLGIDPTEREERFVPSREENVLDMDEDQMRKELEAQEKRLEELKAENERLRREISDKEEELSNIKTQ
jgi:cell division protein FtsB